MNERIKELAREAGAHIRTRNLMSNPPQHVETVELWDDRIEKFAELIVRECAKHAEHAKGMDVDYQKYFKELLFGVSE
jgi:hypothetical protein